MKHYSQTKKAKEEFLRTSIIALVMSGEPDKAFTKEELAEELGQTEREVRRSLAELANYQAVVGLSSKKGYRLLTISDETDTKKFVEYMDLIDHQLAEHRSRVTNIKARMKPLIALRSVIEKKLKEGGVESGISSKGNNGLQEEEQI